MSTTEDSASVAARPQEWVQVVQRLVLLYYLDDPNVSGHEVARTAERLPDVATAIMRQATSSFYGLEPTTGLHRAVVAIGLNQVRQITIDASQNAVDDATRKQLKAPLEAAASAAAAARPLGCSPLDAFPIGLSRALLRDLPAAEAEITAQFLFNTLGVNRLERFKADWTRTHSLNEALETALHFGMGAGGRGGSTRLPQGADATAIRSTARRIYERLIDVLSSPDEL